MKKNQKENVEEAEVEEEATEFIEEKYDPTLSSRIICIELENNQKLYINYTENSSIEDLINIILKRREYKILNYNRANILYSKNFSSLYDLSLCFYDDIKPSYENKLNINVLIDELHRKGLLKSHREPFLIFKENYTPQDYVINQTFYNEEINKIKEKNYNFLAKYYNYLPRQTKFVPNLYLAHPELENYFRHSQKGFNEFTIYHRNRLTCEDEKIDWLIYDKESINFLLKMNKLDTKELPVLKYKDGLAYFEDIYHINDKGKIADSSTIKRTITDAQLKKVVLNLTINIAPPGQHKDIISNKMKVDLTTTAFSLIKKMCDKLMNMKKGLVIDINKKILKAKGLNDYIFSVNEPLVNYTYFIECVKLNKTPEYLIIDNPFLMEDNEQNILDMMRNEKEEVDFSRTTLMPSTTLNMDNNKNKDENDRIRKTTIINPSLSSKRRNELEKIAYYEKSKDDNKREKYLKTDLDKRVNRKYKKVNNTGNPLEDINSLVNLLVKEVDKKIAKNITIKNTPENNIKNKDQEKVTKNLLKKENLFLSLNPNGSEFFSLRKKYKEKQPEISKNLFFNEYKRNNTNNNNIKSKKPPEIDYRLKIPRQLVNKTKIDIHDVNREFNIIFRSAHINSIYNSNESESKIIKTVLLFKFELCCSNHSIGTSKQIRWKTNTMVRNPIFNKRIYFERNYNRLPNFCSLLIRVKFIQYDKSGQVFKSNTILWANYRLFDEDNKLKVGLQKVNLQSKEVSDDIYYCFNDNPDEEKSSKIYFEIENFSNPVEYKLDLKPDYKNIKNVAGYDLNNAIVKQKLEKIQKKSVFEELNNNEKKVLWSNRLFIAKTNSCLARLLQSVNYKIPNVNQELHKIFLNTPNVSIVQAIEFLSGRYVNEEIREFAVNILRKSSFADVSYYLLQLVQALKYEKNIDNPLSRFLLEQAVIHPVTIGHELFWHLRAEMYNPEVQKRYGLYLEVFLNKISEELYKIFKDEDYLLKELVQIAIKVKEKIPKEERNKRFKQDLEKTNNDLISKKKEISLPLNFKYRIRGINYDKCRVMKSKKKPLWLTFKNADPLGEDIVVMLKCGDDLRMDMVTLQLFHAMQTLWFDNGLNLKMSLYKIICTGNQQGMLEMVTNSETLANIHVKEGGAISQFFSKEPIKNWIEKNCVNVSKDEAIRNFMISNVAYCLATFVLGIGDRHNDNIMLKKNGELFHIDFGHFLGHFKYKMGIKRERAPFVFTRQFQNVLGNDNSELFLEFKEKLHKGYLILRKNRDVIVTLLRILLCTGIPELNEKSLRYLESTLSMKKEDKEADDYLEKQLADSLDSVSTKLNFAIHIVANK